MVYGWFKDFVNAIDTEMIRRMLRFVTGSDRIICTSDKITVAFSNDVRGGKRLPRARTCLKKLDLSLDYFANDKQIFEDDLKLAFTEGCSGSGCI